MGALEVGWAGCEVVSLARSAAARCLLTPCCTVHRLLGCVRAWAMTGLISCAGLGARGLESVSTDCARAWAMFGLKGLDWKAGKFVSQHLWAVDRTLWYGS